MKKEFKRMNFKRFVFVPAVIAASFAAQSAFAVNVPGPLVDPAWLNAHLNDVKVLQVSGTMKDFTTAPKTKDIKGKKVVVTVSGHVPGASFVDFKTVRVTRDIDGKKVKGVIPEKAAFEKLVQSWGVQKGQPIVIVPKGLSTGDVDEATRLYWQLKYYGQDNMAILNGGMAQWLADGMPAATDAPAVSAGNWDAVAERKNILATYQEVKQAVEHSGSVELADARPSNQYMGVFTKPGELAGHLPGAKNVPPDLLTTADGASARFLPKASYESMFKAVGLNPGKEIIDYCNTGHLASGLWFVTHEIVGDKKARLYDTSIVEYSMYDGAKMVDSAKLGK
jgi:thiosulfate/3-mercaptopyruvate sulfurtransferase